MVSDTSSKASSASRTFCDQLLRVDSNCWGRCSLEAVDRLLGIPHRKERAHALAPSARARGEILRDLAQDLPLLGVGVLRLVDQHMVDAAIELVEHPGRVAAGEQRQRLVDEVLEVEGAKTHLRLLDTGVDFRREREERARALGGARGLALVDETPQALLLSHKLVLQASFTSFVRNADPCVASRHP
jgi:hypothetical protein